MRDWEEMLDRNAAEGYDSSRRVGRRGFERKGVLMTRQEYISDEAVVRRANAAVRIELEKKRAMDIPVVTYDRETQKIYRENSDGTRTEVGKRMRKGRYSERIAEKA